MYKENFVQSVFSRYVNSIQIIEQIHACISEKKCGIHVVRACTLVRVSSDVLWPTKSYQPQLPKNVNSPKIQLRSNAV